jgi:hypothetical protein
MISVILYGRNDAHGYNLHRRAALSLNCLAEGLTNADDEIIFVDYNTPDELPTFVEAIADTLTDRCLGLLRVLRVPAAIHRERFAERTHLIAIEPVARNAGVRRANQSNRWLLSTNTDMVFLPLVDGSLSEICADLPDGFYGLPRFELPEWLWERLPRTDPRTALAEVERLGPRLGLDEPTVSHEWIRFDAPGDFQLVLRSDFVSVDGFNEQMLLGYHVDANFSRRVLLRRGSIESLGDRLAGYHCNHNRVPTIYHGARLVTNDLHRYFYSVDTAELPEQRETWGLPDAAIDEVPLRERVGVEVGDRVAAVIAAESSARVSSDAFSSFFDVTYDSGHVLPFVADSLIVSSSDITLGYFGANPVLQRLLEELANDLRMRSMGVADLDQRDSVDHLARVADVVVFDLGIDAALVGGSSASEEHEPSDIADRFDQVFAALGRFISLERARLGRGEHPRRVVLVNSASAYWDAYVLAHLECSHTSPHSRVRRATVKPVPDKSQAGTAPAEIMLRQIRWSARGQNAGGPIEVPARRGLKVGNLIHFRGFGEGWAVPDAGGIWTRGQRAELAVTLAGGDRDAVLAIGIDGICVEAGASISVEAFVDDKPVALHDFTRPSKPAFRSLRLSPSPRVLYTVKAMLPDAVTNWLYPYYWRLVTPATLRAGIEHFPETIWRVELPPEAISRGSANLTFVIRKAGTKQSVPPVGPPEGGGELGIHVRSLRLEEAAQPARDRRPILPTTG